VSTQTSGNPKDRIGAQKLPMHLFPTTAIAAGTVGLLNGALKYGQANFRVEPVRASIYIDAALRHLTAWADGEEVDPDDKVPHLCAALANLAILVDAGAHGTLIDDRPQSDPARVRDFLEKMTAHVARLHTLHAQRNPTHYTRQTKSQPATEGGAL